MKGLIPKFGSHHLDPSWQSCITPARSSVPALHFNLLQTVVDHALEERQLQVVLPGESVDGRVGAELLVITNQNQVLAVLAQRRDHVTLQHFRRLLHHHHSGFDLLQHRLVPVAHTVRVRGVI